MAQPPIPQTPALSKTQEGGVSQPSGRPSAELRFERYSFSRLLARFGLGELTAPILRPAKRPAERGQAG
jgi:hypothetical protein